jgi:prepilin-type N-terminal cleavage/methylation domain-containing protein
MTRFSRESSSLRLGVRRAFTLIEIIVALLLSSVLIAMLLPLIGSGLQGSRQSMQRLPQVHRLRTEVDQIWQVYRSTVPSDLPALQAAINEAAASPQASFVVIYNDWVDFDATGTEFVPQDGSRNVLRVTLGNRQGESITSYFFPIP